jgi:spore coat protein U-like protein
LNTRLLFAMLSLMLSETTFGAQLQVEVRVNVQRGCLLITQTRDAGPAPAGVLDFGSTARLDDPTGPLDAQLLSSRFARLECNPDTAYQMQVDGGLHGGIGEVRYLAGADPASKPIPYRLYRDPARLLPLTVDVPVSGVVPSSGSLNLPLYARIDRLAEVPRASTYLDTVQVTLAW